MRFRAPVLAAFGLVLILAMIAAPTATRYRIETSIEQIQDLSAFGQGEQRMEISQAAELTVTLADTTGGRTLHVAVDSVASVGPMAPPAAALAGLKGAWIHGRIDPEGRVSGLRTSNDTSEVLSQLKATLHTFHPRLKPGFKPGESWVDTATIETASPSTNTRMMVVTTYVARGDSTVNGVPVRRLETSFSGTTTGTIQNPMAGELTLEARETGTGVQYVASDGRFLGGSSRATGTATVSAASLPAPIPIKTTRTSAVTALK